MPVRVTGLAAGNNVIERIKGETARAIEPLELHPWVEQAKGAGKGNSLTATIRAVSTAIMALNSSIV